MEQRIRAILFYLSVILFFILLPLILLYSFGYKLDLARFRFIKTGLIYVQTLPDGAKVYLNGRYLKKTTPLSIEELLPGKYKLSLDLESYYPWYQNVSVDSGRTTSLDKIILFPKNPYLNKINAVDIDDFYIFSEDKNYAYCISHDKTTISKSRLNPKEQEANPVCENLALPDNVKDFSLSPDKKKIFYFNGPKLDVLYITTEKINYPQIKESKFYIISSNRIVNAFWYSDSEHIIMVTDNAIRIYETLNQGKDNIVTVLNLNDKHPKAFYDVEDDVLYFTDTQEGADGKLHRGLYRLDIGKKSLSSFIKNLEENIE